MSSSFAEERHGTLSNVESAILPVDLPNLFLGKIEEDKREPDGLLHCSSDLVSPLRFVQLRAVGAPEIPRPIVQDVRMFHGTLWHEWFHATLAESGIKFQYEVNLNKWLPEGWGGTADWLFWHPVLEAWVLGDLKTIKGEGLFFVNKDGAKKDHIWQLSAYWYALAKSGIPLVKGFGIMYWPMNDTNDTVDVTPLVADCQPLPEDAVYGRMEYVRHAVDTYRTAYAETGEYLNAALAPMPEREQKYYWNKLQGVFDVKLVPVWYERFCDFSEELCPRQGTEKIGHYTLDGTFIPRRGYNVEPTIVPTKADFNKRRK
jgi:hypothetical protein